jgi:nitroreductase
MSFADLMHTRQSIRAYRPVPVGDALIQQVLQAGIAAPTACNLQPFYFIVKKGAEQVSSLRSVYDRGWFLRAPVVIAVCCDHSREWVRQADGKRYGFVDAAIAMDHMVLAATELGLATCWVAAFNASEAVRVFNLPEHIEPVALTPLGYPAHQPERRPRKTVEEVVRWDVFS